MSRHTTYARQCPSDGELRALLDHQSTPEVRMHVDACATCAARLVQLSRVASGVSASLDTLEAMSPRVETQHAYQRLQASLLAASEPSLLRRGGEWMSGIWNRPQGRAIAAMATAVVLLLVVALSPMRTVADDFLNQFRVQKFAAITIPMNFEQPDQTAMFQMMSAAAQSPAVHDELAGLGTFETTFQFDGDHLPTALTEEQAAAQYDGLRVPQSLPDGFDSAPQAYVTEAGSASYTLNVDKARQIIAQIGLPIYAFDSVTSPTLKFSVDVPSAAVLRYQDAAGENLVVGQMVSPELDIPSEFNMDQLREDILRFPGLPSDLVSQLRAVDDWESTLIVPIPEDATSESVKVDGNPGLLIKAEEGNGVLWEDGGTLYAVFGQVSADQIMATAKSLSGS